jgi:hypothetical protein
VDVPASPAVALVLAEASGDVFADSSFFPHPERIKATPRAATHVMFEVFIRVSFRVPVPRPIACPQS